MVNSCAMRTRESYTAVSPCGWYLPSTSPTTRAHFLPCAGLLSGKMRGGGGCETAACTAMLPSCWPSGDELAGKQDDVPERTGVQEA